MVSGTGTRGRLQALAKRAQKTLPARVLTAYGESQAGNYALALAFASFMATFPMMLGALSLIGLAIRDPGTEARFTSLVLQVFPATAQPEIQGALKGVKDSWSWLGVVSLAGLVWSASSIFSTMEFALTRIFGTRQRDMLRQRLAPGRAGTTRPGLEPDARVEGEADTHRGHRAAVHRLGLVRARRQVDATASGVIEMSGPSGDSQRARRMNSKEVHTFGNSAFRPVDRPGACGAPRCRWV